MITGRNPGRAGYSLVEVLVVLAMIGLMSGAAYLALRPDRDAARAAAEQLQIDLAQAETLAVTRGRFIGLRLRRDGYDFLTYSNGQWSALADPRGLTGRSLEAGITLSLAGRAGRMETGEAVPDYWFDPTGANESAVLVLRDGEARWRVETGGRGGVRLSGGRS